MDTLVKQVMESRKKNFDSGNKGGKIGTLLDFLWKRKRTEEDTMDEIEKQERPVAVSAVRG